MTLCLSQAATIPTTLSWTAAMMWMNLCTLLLVYATVSSDVVTLREGYQLNLQLDVMIHGLISFKKSLKKAIKEMKEESIRVKVG